MTLKHRRFTVTVTFSTLIESESAEEAERIIGGVLDNATDVIIREGEDDEIHSDRILICAYTEVGPDEE